jgi:putative sterol carrier protein
VWTIEIGPEGATAEPRPARRADLTLRATIPDFIRIGTGVLSPTMGIIEGVVAVEGDAVLAARIPYLFGVEAT